MTGHPLTLVLSRLKVIKRNGKGFLACCPAHDDSNPSLSINEGDDGRVLLNCFAGCDTASVVDALGLEMSDLFPKEQPAPPPPGAPTSIYSYRDADRSLLFQVLRFKPKTFRQRRPDGNDGWINDLKGVKRVLYNLPELIEADPAEPVYIVEGEKDVNRLASLGLLATCNPMGAGKWHDSYSETLRGRTCIILHDNDKAGQLHAIRVRRELADYAQAVKIVELPNLPAGGDVSDWLEAGGTVEELEAICDSDAFSDFSSFSDLSDMEKERNEKRGSINLITIADLLNEPEKEISWLVHEVLPSGGISLLTAKPKVGKSTTVRELCLCVARGLAFLGRPTKQGTVVYLALEEKRSGVAAHFRNMGAADDPILLHIGAVGKENIRDLEMKIREHNAALAIVDPLLRFVRIRDLNDYAEVTAAMEPLVEIARNTGCHILCLHHLNKLERPEGDANDGILGSTALFGAVDTSLIMRKRGESRTLETTQRYGPNMPPTVLVMDPDTGHISAAGDYEAIQLQKMADEIKALLKHGPLAEKDIKERIGGNTAICGKAVRWLFDNEQITRTGEGKRGSPYVYSLMVEASDIDYRSLFDAVKVGH